MWKGKKVVKPQENIKALIKKSDTDTKYPYKVCICGIIRDGEPYFKSTIANLVKIASCFNESKIIVVESDSSDNTVKLFSSVKDILFYSMGNLEKTYPSREERIAYCRNFYLKTVCKDYKHYDLMIVVDLDDVLLEPINPKIFERAMSQEMFSKWDAVFANQSYRYYDIWALRNEEVNYDCWAKIHSNEMSKIDAILKHQYHIPKNTPYIPVISAFGGLGIYKMNMINETLEYISKYNGSNICEHVPFNTAITSNGGRLFIDPSMVLETPTSFAKYYV